MSYNLLVLDLDGTVTNSDKIITPETTDALMKLQEAGKKVVLASGRPTPGILPLAKQLDLAKYGSYILSFNGARITDCSTNELLFDQTVDHKYLDELFAFAKEYNTGLITFEDTTVVSAFEPNEYVGMECRINKLDVRVPENFVEAITFPINKILFPGDPSILEKLEPILQERFGSELSIFRSEPFFLEVMPPKIDKAYSLGKLLERIGMSKEEMICCGDGFNDLSMIKYAGLGVAMSNAQQVVLDAADYITLSNDEDGIIPVIEKFMME